MFFEELVPEGDVLKGILFGDIADKHCELCIFEVGGDETAVSFLSCGVPHLQSVVVPVFCDVFDVEVDSYRCLCGQADTLWVYSYLLVVYRSIIELLPTPWSPRNTMRIFSLFRLVFDDVTLIIEL